MRKLADFAFMIRDYKFAHTIYDTVRRDYATDKAFKYHAGTQVKGKREGEDVDSLLTFWESIGNDWHLSINDESTYA